jgi:hypothetical protein
MIIARWFLMIRIKDIFTHPIVENNIPQFALEKFGGRGVIFCDLVLGLGYLMVSSNT